MSKKILPIALIGIGALAAGIAIFSKPVQNNTGASNYPVPVTNENGWINAFQNLITTISTQITNITGALKGKGIITGSKLVQLSNQNLTGLIVDTTKNVKANDVINIIPEINSDLSFAGNFRVVAIGDQFGNQRGNLIVIQKPFVMSNKPTKGTFNES